MPVVPLAPENFGSSFRVPPGPVTVTESAVICCTCQLATISPSPATIGLAFPAGWNIAKAPSAETMIPVNLGKSVGCPD